MPDPSGQVWSCPPGGHSLRSLEARPLPDQQKDQKAWPTQTQPNHSGIKNKKTIINLKYNNLNNKIILKTFRNSQSFFFVKKIKSIIKCHTSLKSMILVLGALNVFEHAL
jgi:hypothetical protein